jgi:O-antigen biosynthesis protein WbqP
MIRVFDLFFASVGLIIGAPLLLLVGLLAWVDTGAPLFRQSRLGRHKREFILVKFRTMNAGTVNLPTHLVPSSAVTRIGRVLRKSKLDELPQLWNVLRGDMSLVGPRPGLPTQVELTRARDAHDVFSARPGITGVAQLLGIDMSTPELLAKVDAAMLKNIDVKTYFILIGRTLMGHGYGDRVVP